MEEHSVKILMILFNVQGVPRNMTEARRLESRLWYLNKFEYFVVNRLKHVWFVKQQHLHLKLGWQINAKNI